MNKFSCEQRKKNLLRKNFPFFVSYVYLDVTMRDVSVFLDARKRGEGVCLDTRSAVPSLPKNVVKNSKFFGGSTLE